MKVAPLTAWLVGCTILGSPMGAHAQGPQLAEQGTTSRTARQASPSSAAAPSLGLEVFASMAHGHFFHRGAGDDGFDRPDVAAGIRLRRSSGFGIEFGINHMLGSERTEGPPSTWLQMWATAPLARFYDTVDSSVTIASANLSYLVARPRAQPYVTAGIGIRFRSQESTEYIITNGQLSSGATYRQSTTQAVANVGVGVQIRLTDRLSATPEFRSYFSDLFLLRTSVGIGYRW